MPKFIDLASTGLRRSARLANKNRQKYGLLAKLLLALIGACGVAKNPHIFLTKANQNIQEINRHFDGTLKSYGPIVFAENQEHNEYYIFKYMLSKPDK